MCKVCTHATGGTPLFSGTFAQCSRWASRAVLREWPDRVATEFYIVDVD